jgi:hypothetical protein
VIIGRQYLVDLNAGFVVWRYTSRSGFSGVPDMQSYSGNICYQVDGSLREGPHLRSMKLPHEAIRTAMENIDPQDIYALQPGGTVSLQVQAGAETEAIRQALQQRIAENGWGLAADSSVRIIVTTKAGESRSQTFHQGLGGAGAASTVTFRPTISEVDLQVGEESAWRIETETSAPVMLMSKQGQTAQDAVRAYEKPDMSFFSNLPLPKQIIKPKHLAGLGVSELSASGVVDGSQPRSRPR